MHYLDIILLPDVEDNIGFIWQKVYQQVHIALSDNKIAENKSVIACSFPGYAFKDFPLGNKLRLLASSDDLLESLSVNYWLKRLADYVHITAIKSVPDSVTEYVCFSRKQFNTNISRMARRRAKRKGEPFEQALLHYSDFKDEQTNLPYINIKSLSRGEQFRLFIEQSVEGEAVSGEFNCYGLAKDKATVPWF